MKVIIVGGGFGGVRAALKLANKKGFEVQLISPASYFEYHAALYRSATGRSPLEVAIPLKDFFDYAKNIEIIDDKIVDLDEMLNKVTGESGTKYHYDKIVLALGNVTDYFSIDGLEEYSFGVKTIHEALKLKRHLHEQLIEGKTEANYVVIGAGATGVELAAELTAYIKKLNKKHKIKRNFTVNLIEASARVVPAMPQNFAQLVERRLRKLSVKIFTNAPVKSETFESIQLPIGEVLSHTVIWTAGVANNPFFAQFPDLFKTSKNKKIIVDSFLQAAPSIYVIGDSANTQFSGMAQTALRDANFVADNLIRESKQKSPNTYAPKKPIYAIPVGPHWAVVLWGSVLINGHLGWLLRRLADLRLYLKFLPLDKALSTWKYGFVDEEICPICKQ